MKHRRGVIVFLMIVLVLQLLPVRQMVQYFMIDNTTTEELVDGGKFASKKARPVEEDHKSMCGLLQELPGNENSNVGLLFYTDEQIPANYSKDVHTPPPNFFSLIG